MFKGNQMCIPRCSMRDNILQVKYGGGLARHFGKSKRYAQLNDFIIGQV